jgi:hypothetical protein
MPDPRPALPASANSPYAASRPDSPPAARSPPTRSPASRRRVTSRRWSSRSLTPSSERSSPPAPSQTTPPPGSPDLSTRSTTAATRPSSGSCSRPPSGPESSSTYDSTTLDLIGRLITIRRGKGGRGRVIPVGQATTEALLAYLDHREQHPLAASPDLWLGNRGQQFGREGLSRALRRRAARAGVQGFRAAVEARRPDLGNL